MNYPTNTDRANWARNAVRTFMTETGMTAAGESLETGARDLLANLLHLARSEGWDTRAMVSAAEAVHAEANGDVPPSPRFSWYVVTGRVCGDDEDSASFVYADSPQSAMEAFKDEIIGDTADPDSPPEFYINTVVDCGANEPKFWG